MHHQWSKTPQKSFLKIVLFVTSFLMGRFAVFLKWLFIGYIGLEPPAGPRNRRKSTVKYTTNRPIISDVTKGTIPVYLYLMFLTDRKVAGTKFMVLYLSWFLHLNILTKTLIDSFILLYIIVSVFVRKLKISMTTQKIRFSNRGMLHICLWWWF